MALYERTATKPEHEGDPAWMAGHRFDGTPTGGGIRDNSHPDHIVHHPDAVRLVGAAA